jgi:type I restriction enzyme R subunit
MWEQILTKSSVLELIDKFVISQGDALIFPRYHQLDAVRSVLAHAKDHGAGQKYLIQHSAGSGKTNTISWLAHRLATLHDENNDAIFNTVLVITDRTVLDKQLQDAVTQIDHQRDFVAQINQDSKQLADALNGGTKVIISTLQKFPFVLKHLQAQQGKRFAVIIDEAHSSTTGKSMNKLTEGLSLEEAALMDQQLENETPDFEDQLLDEIDKVGPQANITFVALTATPKAGTLAKFGTPDVENQMRPFHLYAMKQAIEEGFILDVLKNYTTYKSFYEISKKIQDDPSLNTSKASKSLARFVSLHPTNIEAKTEIIIEHFRSRTAHLLGGEAKAMLVTSSRLHAVRYKEAFDRYIREKGYSDLKALVAYSGKVEERSETEWNGFGEAQLPEKFNSPEYQVLIVAEKYQTGFDQPKLQTMYVDKKLSGLKAVQTLSRLNRTYPGKEACGTFILDFQNTHEEILEAFKPYYEETTMIGEIDPNELNGLSDQLMRADVLREDEIRNFCEIYMKDGEPSVGDVSRLHSFLDQAASRFERLEEEAQRKFVTDAKRFVSLYVFVIQVFPYRDVDKHQLYVYLQMLLRKVTVGVSEKVDLYGKVELVNFEVREGQSGDIILTGGDGGLEPVIGGGGTKEPEKDLLSVIIDRFNAAHASEDFAQHRSQIEQLAQVALADELVQQQAINNNLDDFRLGFQNQFINYTVQSYEQNQEFFSKVLSSEQFKNDIVGIVSEFIYKQYNDEPRI